jgi:hypothetical protein
MASYNFTDYLFEQRSDLVRNAGNQSLLRGLSNQHCGRPSPEIHIHVFVECGLVPELVSEEEHEEERDWEVGRDESRRVEGANCNTISIMIRA